MFLNGNEFILAKLFLISILQVKVIAVTLQLLNTLT